MNASKDSTRESRPTHTARAQHGHIASNERALPAPRPRCARMCGREALCMATGCSLSTSSGRKKRIETHERLRGAWPRRNQLQLRWTPSRHLTPASFRCPSRHDLPSAPGLHQMLRLAVHSSPTRHTAHLYPTTCTRWGNGHDRAAGLAQAGLGGDCACRTVAVSLTAASSGRRSRSSSVAHTCTRSVALRALALMNLLTNFISLSLAR